MTIFEPVEPSRGKLEIIRWKDFRAACFVLFCFFTAKNKIYEYKGEKLELGETQMNWIQQFL